MTLFIKAPVGGVCGDCPDNPCVGDSDCNSCDPKLKKTYTVTVSGWENDEGGDCTSFNGVHQITETGCIWISDDYSTDGLRMWWIASTTPKHWYIEMGIDVYGCFASYPFTDHSDSCVPTGTYTFTHGYSTITMVVS